LNNRPPKKIGDEYFRPVFALLVFLALFAFTSCGSPEEKKMKFYNKGHALYANSEYEKAVAEFENALQVDPKFVDARYMLGMTRWMQGDLEGAYIFLSRIAAADPTHLKTQIQLGELLLIGGHPERAMENIERVLAMDPGNIEGLLLKARIYLSGEEAYKGMAFLEEMILSGVRGPEPFLLLAKAHLGDGNVKGAEEVLLRGIAADDNSIRLRRMLLDVFRSEWKMDEAVAQVRRMIAIEPDNHDHKIELAVLCWDAGLVDTARGILEELLSSLREDQEAWLKVAGFLVSRGAYENAESVLKEGIKKEGKALRLRLALAELYRGVAGAAGAERAVNILEEALRLAKEEWNQDVVRIRIELAGIHLVRGELDKASVRVEEVIRKEPRDIDARRIRGNILLSKGDGAGAASEFQSVVKDRPRDTRAYLLLAQSLLVEGKELPALDALYAAFRIDPQSVEVYGALVRYHVLREEFETAEAYLLKAIEDRPYILELRAELGDLYVVWNNPRKVEAAYTEIKKIAPNHPLGYLKMGGFLAAQGKWDRAAQEYHMAIDRNPFDLSVYLLLGRCYVEGKQYERAERVYQEALLRWPGFTAAREGLNALRAAKQGR